MLLMFFCVMDTLWLYDLFSIIRSFRGAATGFDVWCISLAVDMGLGIPIVHQAMQEEIIVIE